MPFSQTNPKTQYTFLYLTGIKSTGQNIEQSELESLRKEVKRYKKKYAKEDKEMEISSDESDEPDEEEQRRIDEEMKKRMFPVLFPNPTSNVQRLSQSACRVSYSIY